MSDQNSGLQPIGGGGLAPIGGGGLAPIGGAQSSNNGSGGNNSSNSSNATSAGMNSNSLGSVGGAPSPTPQTNAMGRVGGAGTQPVSPTAGMPPSLRPPTPTPGTLASPLNLSGAPSVYVPPRATDAEVWQDPDAGSARKIWAGVGASAVAALAIGAFFLFRAPARATVPTAYVPYTSGDKLWGFDAPQGWTETASGAATGDEHAVGFNGVVCTSGSAEINLSISTVNGLIKNQLLFGNDITPEAMGGSRASGIQKSTLKPFKKTLRDYQETELAADRPWQMEGDVIKGVSINGMTMPDIKSGPDVKWAEFKASANKWGLGGPVHGYRASLAGSTLIVYGLCQCSERDWPAIKPTFERVLTSVHETALGKKGEKGGGSLISPIGGL